MDYRAELLMMREDVMVRVENLIDDQLNGIIPQDDIDALVKNVCDTICDTIDPAGFPSM